MSSKRTPKPVMPILHPRPVRLHAFDVAQLSVPADPPRPESVLEEAGRITSGDRHSSYGEPLDNHQCTADLITAFMRRKYGAQLPAFTAEDVCMINILQKCAREANTPKRDNLVDICGYARNHERCGEERKRRAGG
jgi:hypothetical protein